MVILNQDNLIILSWETPQKTKNVTETKSLILSQDINNIIEKQNFDIWSSLVELT